MFTKNTIPREIEDLVAELKPVGSGASGQPCIVLDELVEVNLWDVEEVLVIHKRKDSRDNFLWVHRLHLFRILQMTFLDPERLETSFLDLDQVFKEVLVGL